MLEAGVLPDPFQDLEAGPLLHQEISHEQVVVA